MRPTEHPLQKEFKESHGNQKPWSYDYRGGHGPAWGDAYVEWLEDLVMKMRTRPDLQTDLEDW